jgi:hypothetical protein
LQGAQLLVHFAEASQDAEIDSGCE